MKKTLLVSFLASVFSINAAEYIELRNINVNGIYQQLSQEGHADTQSFTVTYKRADGTFERNNKGELVSVGKLVTASDQGIPAVPNFGDVKSYQTEGEQGGAVYKYTYEYTYMQINGQGQWVLTHSTIVFLYVKEDITIEGN